MSDVVELTLQGGVRGFAEDKDEAKRIRREVILPALVQHKRVVLNFEEIKYSTQSFVHALVGEALQIYGETVLEKLEFRSCAPQIKSLVQLVVDYSLGGFSKEDIAPPPDSAKRKPSPKKTTGRS